MKKIKLQKKLELNKKTVADLKNDDMKKIKGGTIYTRPIVSCKICPD
ncbi:MAG: class I lanthipeptide [Candidatus Aminicenantes bacterium]|nr:class I lanthipeptide [Candidatus Aminicenantes bacterium]